MEVWNLFANGVELVDVSSRFRLSACPDWLRFRRSQATTAAKGRGGIQAARRGAKAARGQGEGTRATAQAASRAATTAQPRTAAA